MCVCVCQVRAIISAFGQLKALTLLRDAAGTFTGAALAEFVDPSVLNTAIAGLSVLNVGGGPERLVVSRAANTEHVIALQQLIQQQQAALLQRLTGRTVPGAAGAAAGVGAVPTAAPTATAAMAAPAAATGALPPLPAAVAVASTGAVAGGSGSSAAAAAAPPPAQPPQQDSTVQLSDSGGAAGAGVGDAAGQSKQPQQQQLCVVRLECMVTREELLDAEEYEDILEDTREEVQKYGTLKQVCVCGEGVLCLGVLARGWKAVVVVAIYSLLSIQRLAPVHSSSIDAALGAASQGA